MKAGRGFTTERMVQLGRVSRASFYRFDESALRSHYADLGLRDAIQRIALEWPSYGRPRITAELRRGGWTVNPKRVYRILREDNLLCIRKRKFVVTTDSNHGRKVYPNLAHTMVLTGVDQFWVADITYIRLREEFVFLAVILDAFSRRVIGWALDRILEDQLTLAALKMALSRRSVQPGLVHHSDRGSQYASGDYRDLLEENGIGVSMSRKGNPWDNAACESFMKTLKYEEVFRSEYRDRMRRICRFASSWRKSTTKSDFTLRSGMCRPRSSKPVSRHSKRRPLRGAFCMSFNRHREIYPFDEDASMTSVPAHRLDEFPVGYSLAGCAPAVPASASPTASEYALQSSCRSIIFHRTVNSVLTVCRTPGGRSSCTLILSWN